MYISENIHYLPKEDGFLFFSFSHAAFVELMRRISSQRKRGFFSYAEKTHKTMGSLLKQQHPYTHTRKINFFNCFPFL